MSFPALRFCGGLFFFYNLLTGFGDLHGRYLLSTVSVRSHALSWFWVMQGTFSFRLVRTQRFSVQEAGDDILVIPCIAEALQPVRRCHRGNVILQAAKGRDVNVTVTTFYPEGADASFDENIKKWINADSTNLANNGGDDTVAAVTAMGYDAYFFALAALQKAGSTDPAKVMEALWSTEINGVTGPIALDQTNGDAIRNTAFVKQADTVNGVWIALDPVTIG